MLKDLAGTHSDVRNWTEHAAREQEGKASFTRA